MSELHRFYLTLAELNVIASLGIFGFNQVIENRLGCWLSTAYVGVAVFLLTFLRVKYGVQ